MYFTFDFDVLLLDGTYYHSGYVARNCYDGAMLDDLKDLYDSGKYKYMDDGMGEDQTLKDAVEALYDQFVWVAENRGDSVYKICHITFPRELKEYKKR